MAKHIARKGDALTDAVLESLGIDGEASAVTGVEIISDPGCLWSAKVTFYVDGERLRESLNRHIKEDA